MTTTTTTNLQVSAKALQVISAVQSAINSTPNGVSFFRIKKYKNKFGEVANHLVNIGASYGNAVQRDIEFLKTLNPISHTWASRIEDIIEAKDSLLASLLKPSESRSEGQRNAYTTIISGVKVHNDNGQLYVWGYAVPEKKEVIVNGVYPIVKSSALTIAKNEIRKLMHSTRYREFKVDVGNVLVGGGQTIEV